MLVQRVYSFDHSLNLETVLYVDYIVGHLARVCSHLIHNYSMCLELSAGIVFLLSIYAFISRGFSVSQSTSLLHSFVLCGSLYLVSGGQGIFIVVYPLAVLMLVNKVVREEWTLKGLPVGIIKLLIESYYIFISGPLAFLYYLIAHGLSLKRLTLVRMTMLFYALIVSFYAGLDVRVFDYPEQARFTDISSFSKMGEIVFGDVRIPFTGIYTAYVTQNSLSLLFLIILCSSFVPSLIRGIVNARFKQRVALESFLVVLITFSISGFFFLRDPARYVTSPEATLYKVMPGLIWRFSPWLVPSLVWLCFYISCALILKYTEIRKTSFWISIIVCIPILYVKHPAHSIVKVNINGHETIPVENTPSHYVLRSYAESSYLLPRIKASYVQSAQPGMRCLAATSRHVESAQNIFDDKAKTVWRTKGNQRVGDYAELVCKDQLKFDRLRVVAPATDFPRAFKIEIANEGEDLQLLKQFDKWNGALVLSNEGHPYFSAQSDVTIYFPETIKANKVRLTLLEKEKTYDWSIAELVFEKINKSDSPKKTEMLDDEN